LRTKSHSITVPQILITQLNRGLRKPELVQLIERQRQFWTDFDTKTTMNLIRSRLLAKDSPFTKEQVDCSKTFQELSAGALTRFSSSSPLTEIDDEDQSVHATPEQCVGAVP
jgi:hypothetical protein